MSKLSQIGTGLAAMLAATNVNAEEVETQETRTAEAQAVQVATLTQADCLKLDVTDKMVACLRQVNEAKRKQAAAEIAAGQKRVAAKRTENIVIDERNKNHDETIKVTKTEREQVDTANNVLTERLKGNLTGADKLGQLDRLIADVQSTEDFPAKEKNAALKQLGQVRATLAAISRVMTNEKS